MKRCYLLLVAFGMLVFWGVIGFLPALLFCKPDERSAFGDMFGAVNALFSGFALVGVIVAIFLQRADLLLQREEVKLTREELRKAAEAQLESLRVQERQHLLAKRVAIIQANSALLQSANDRMKVARDVHARAPLGAQFTGSAKLRQIGEEIAQIESRLSSLMEEDFVD